MRLKRFKYEKSSPLKTCFFEKSLTWAAMKAKIAVAFDVHDCRDSTIIIADSELEIDNTMPTLGAYLVNRHTPMGRTVVGLCVSEADSSDEVRIFALLHVWIGYSCIATIFNICIPFRMMYIPCYLGRTCQR